MYKTATSVGLVNPATGVNVLDADSSDIVTMRGTLTTGLEVDRDSWSTSASWRDPFAGLTATTYGSWTDCMTHGNAVTPIAVLSTITANATTTGWTVQKDGVYQLQLHASGSVNTGVLSIRVAIVISYTPDGTANVKRIARDYADTGTDHCHASTSYTGVIPAGSVVQLLVWYSGSSALQFWGNCTMTLLREVASGTTPGSLTLN